MGTIVDSHASRRPGEIPTLEVRLLGPMTVSRGGVAMSLPPSRKVRALFAYLALALVGTSLLVLVQKSADKVEALVP